MRESRKLCGGSLESSRPLYLHSPAVVPIHKVPRSSRNTALALGALNPSAAANCCTRPSANRRSPLPRQASQTPPLPLPVIPAIEGRGLLDGFGRGR